MLPDRPLQPHYKYIQHYPELKGNIFCFQEVDGPINQLVFLKMTYLIGILFLTTVAELLIQHLILTSCSSLTLVRVKSALIMHVIYILNNLILIGLLQVVAVHVDNLTYALGIFYRFRSICCQFGAQTFDLRDSINLAILCIKPHFYCSLIVRKEVSVRLNNYYFHLVTLSSIF